MGTSNGRATFCYSQDGTSWTRLEVQLAMKYSLDHFMGYWIALFHYATGSTGGFVDFDYFKGTSPVIDMPEVIDKR